jgi:periplasmic mercuric ion binding protein
MKIKIKIAPCLLAFAVGISGVTFAAPRTVTLNVKSMTCATCPITVKKALEQVSGVNKVAVDYPSKTATVQFDDATASPDQLTEATKSAGYPSTLLEDKK